MSMLENEQQGMETAERPFLVREFTVADVAVEGRTVDVRLVPFGEVARVADPPKWEPYEEEWMPGCFDHQLGAANRVHARYGHSPHAIDVVGHGIELRAVERDGYHISTKIHQTVQGDTALELLRDGALPCVSLEARPVRSVRTAAGVVQRMKANLRGFAFCQQGAFSGAQVLAIREPAVIEDEIADEFLLPEMDAGVIERCRSLGIRLPDRYQAHPDQTEDTPAAAGTSSSGGTRQTGNDNTTEE
jgi:HK97 family phage prohead protease